MKTKIVASPKIKSGTERIGLTSGVLRIAAEASTTARVKTIPMKDYQRRFPLLSRLRAIMVDPTTDVERAKAAEAETYVTWLLDKLSQREEIIDDC